MWKKFLKKISKNKLTMKKKTPQNDNKLYYKKWKKVLLR